MRTYNLSNTSFFYSIVICTKNSETTIHRPIQSLKCQEFKNFEIVIVDKNSTDNTLPYILEEFPDAKIIDQKSVGIYDAFNEGISNSSGDYILFLNSDDLISNNCLSKVYEYLKEEALDAFFIPVFSAGGYKNKIKYNKLFLGCDYCFPGHSASFFIKRHLHKQIGLYNTSIKYSADHELFIRLLSNKINLKILDIGVFGIFFPGGFSSQNNYLDKRIEEFKFRIVSKEKSSLIYCFAIFPLQFIWYIIKLFRIN